MYTWLRSFTATAAIVSPLILPAQPATAATGTGAFILTGSGSISPGASEVPATQAVTFTGTMDVVGTDPLTSSYPCDMEGIELGNVAAAAGILAGTCGPWSCPSAVYARAGVALTMTCATSVTVGMECIFMPTTTYPTNSYDLVCAGTYVRN